MTINHKLVAAALSVAINGGFLLLLADAMNWTHEATTVEIVCAQVDCGGRRTCKTTELPVVRHGNLYCEARKVIRL